MPDTEEEVCEFFQLEINRDQEVMAEYARRTYLLKHGSLMKARRHILFNDGTCHYKGQVCLVTIANVPYYIAMFNDYELLENR